jgi:hypothetical protein
MIFDYFLEVINTIKEVKMLIDDYKSLVENLAFLNEDGETEVKSAEEMDKEVEKTNKEVADKEVSEDGKNPRQLVHELIKPQVEIASSTISSIKDAYADNCNNTKELKSMIEQVKNWESTIRGACRTIAATVENKKMIKKNENGKYVAWDGRDLKKICSGMAYGRIIDESNRDYSTLDLAAAIIVFYNSLQS